MLWHKQEKLDTSLVLQYKTYTQVKQYEYKRVVLQPL